MNRNYADDTIDSLEKAAASIGRPVHHDDLGGLCYFTSAGVHSNGRAWIGIGHHPGECVAPAIVFFLPVVRHHDGTLSLAPVVGAEGGPAPYPGAVVDNETEQGPVGCHGAPPARASIDESEAST